jgi:hypothetical protein
MHWFHKFILGMKLYMFRTVSMSIIRSFSLYTQQWYMSYRFIGSLQAGLGWNILILLASCQQTCITYTIPMCRVKNYLWWTEELSETYRVSFQNKFEKLVRLIGFIIRNLSRCTVTWTTHLFMKVKWKSCTCVHIYFDSCFSMCYKFNSRPCVICDIEDGSVTGGSEFVSSRRIKNFSSFLFAKGNLIGAPEWRVEEFRVF